MVRNWTRFVYDAVWIRRNLCGIWQRRETCFASGERLKVATWEIAVEEVTTNVDAKFSSSEFLNIVFALGDREEVFPSFVLRAEKNQNTIIHWK